MSTPLAPNLSMIDSGVPTSHHLCLRSEFRHPGVPGTGRATRQSVEFPLRDVHRRVIREGLFPLGRPYRGGFSHTYDLVINMYNEVVWSATSFI